MKKSGVLIAVGLLAAASLVGCSADQPDADNGVPQEEGKPDSLTMLVTASPSADGLRALAADYEDETGIAIEFVEVPYEQLATRIILAAQSGESTFDMAQVDGFTMPQVVAGKGLLDLDEFIAEDDEYDYDDFPEGIKNYAMQDGVSYGLPLSTEPYLQWYRSDLYDEVGIEPAATWDDLFDNADALKEAGHYGAVGVYGAAGSAHHYNAVLVGLGGRLIDPETNRPMLDTEVAATALDRYLDLLEYGPSGTASATIFDAVNSFSQLDVGQMATLASGWWSTINDPEETPNAGNYKTAPPALQAVGDFEPSAVLYGWVASISQASPHQQAAWDFLSWALSKDNAEAFIDAGAPPPARISTTSNPEFLEKLPYLEAVGESVESGVPIDRIPEMAQIITVLSQTLNSIATEQMTREEGLEKAQDQLLNILVQSGRYTG
ncbi:extracellular solute-binding protein [Microbacterium sp. EST19A]|uniref:ABC transporter substrate-binding protein n=1 Tax=Microbacterium sp. EST19A TaxID=2862681 RepID=UPI001CBDC7EE|nr:extracellular solute-binding protein [Microbacterium sp. EST19A]